MFHSKPYCQYLASTRALSLGAYTAHAGEVSSFEWNPGGLIAIQDWEFGSTNFYSEIAGKGSFTLQSSGVGKRFLSNHAAAFRLSPGAALDFVIPSFFTIGDSTNAIVTSFEKKISYSEPYILGYALRLSPTISLGVSASYASEHVTDTKYSVDSNAIVRSTLVEYEGAGWSVDWGWMWDPFRDVRVGFVARNLFRITESQMSDDVQNYRREIPKLLSIGGMYGGIDNAQLSLDIDSEKRVRIGMEWVPASAIAVRAGIYGNAGASRPVEAASVGIGTSFGAVTLDAGYLKFIDQTNRKGQAEPEMLTDENVSNIAYNPFTSDRVSFSASLNLGRTRESLARIEYVEMLSDVYPASHVVHAFRPLGKARVRNISRESIQARVSFYMEKLMDSPTQSKPFSIPSGEVLEIPFFAVFNEAVRAASSLMVRDGEVYVSAVRSEEYDDKYQTRVLVHGRNDWNGDVMVLRYFMTPDDPAVIAFSRDVLNKHKPILDTLAPEIRNVQKARLLFDEFSSRMLYVGDPRKSQDYVQYPAETLNLRAGDCDDLTVAYSSLLASTGVAVAFVDVIPPDRPQDGHIYMMFDTGVAPSRGEQLAKNPKRFVARKNAKGEESLWIPIETTAAIDGFEAAWETGAREYFQSVEMESGLIDGWVRIVDVEMY